MKIKRSNEQPALDPLSLKLWRRNRGRGRRALQVLLLSAVAATAGLIIAGRPSPKYVAHEWGTFTSVQGGDGVLLDWRPLESSHLPKFVYDWMHPGLGRLPAGALF